MIRAGNIATVAFGDAADGDPRRDPDRREALSAALGIGSEWAWVRQVHGTRVVRADGPGVLGEGDAVFTTVPGLPLAVATADCYPVAMAGAGVIGIAHAGWRGSASGVVPTLRKAMSDAGCPPDRAAIGPGIGPCCFEVGEEVLDRFPGFDRSTTWGSSSVDLAGWLGYQLQGMDVWLAGECTMSDAGFRSFRRDATPERQVSVAWLEG